MYYRDDELTVYDLTRDLFKAAAVTCVVCAMQRIARGVMLRGRVEAYDELSDAYTPEEREALIHRIKKESLR